MNTGTFYGTVQKYGYLMFENFTSLSSDEADDSDTDIELSDYGVSDVSDSRIDSDDPGLSETSQELRYFLNSSSDIDWVGVTPTTKEHSFTADEKK